jgi:hypothetical protein
VLPAKRTIGQSLRPIARIRIAVDIQILRERNRPFSQLVLRLNIKQPDPEALDQIISKRTSSQRRSSGQKLLPGAAALSVGLSVGQPTAISGLPFPLLPDIQQGFSLF